MRRAKKEIRENRGLQGQTEPTGETAEVVVTGNRVSREYRERQAPLGLPALTALTALPALPVLTGLTVLTERVYPAGSSPGPTARP